jgi:glycosyl transferase family 87
VIERRDAVLAAVLGVVLFVVCALLAHAGPLASGSFGDIYEYRIYQLHMAHGLWPYRDFFDEYPPLAQPLFLVVGWLPGSYVHAFRWTMVVLGAASLVVLVASIASLGSSRRRLAIATATVGVSPLLLGQSAFNEFDFWPAFLTSAAVLAFIRRREGTGYVLLALAVAAKTYPIVLLPVALIWTWERGRGALVKRGLAWFVGALVVVHLPFAVAGPGGLRYSYWVQLKRGLEVESLGGGFLLLLNRLGIHHVDLHPAPPGQTEVSGGLAHALAGATTLVELAALALVVWLCWRRRPDPLIAAAASVVAFVAFAKSFSPQYVDWLVPLVPAAGALASGLLLVILGVTHVELQRFLHTTGGMHSEHYKDVLLRWVVPRDLLVLVLYALLVRLLWRSPARSSP